MTSQDPTIAPAQVSQAMDPLAQLQDIHLPAEIGLWPPAWGWWLLACLLIICSGALIYFVKRHRARNAYRALALRELNLLNQQFSSTENADYLQGLSVLLRRTALSGFSNQFNASLKGNEWLEWLDDHCPSTKGQFSQGVGTALLIGQYQKNPEFDRVQLHQLSMQWIKQHRNQWQGYQQKNIPEANHV